MSVVLAGMVGDTFMDIWHSPHSPGSSRTLRAPEHLYLTVYAL